jgi:dTDP-4-amino-4,6-dideoxygalactose transaminase
MIPIADPQLDDAEKRRVEAVLDDGMIADGPEVRAFETEFAEFCGSAHGVATTNGTTALHAALHALDVGPGDRVLTSPFSFAATANAIRWVGAEPVFADVDPETFDLDPYAVEEVLRREDDVDALLPVHLYGLPAAMDHLLDLAEEHDLAVIEDAAQAHGATYDGRPVGSFGDAACFSFYPTKNMTSGEGGMITTDRDDVAKRAARFIDHGQEGRYHHVEVGHNFRLTSIGAAMGRAQLEKLPAFNRARRTNARQLTDALADADVVTPTEPGGRRHVYHQYTIRTDDRDGLAAHLDDHGIGTKVYYPTPIHRQPVYRDLDASAPVAERLAGQVLSLPVHPAVSESDVETIAETVIDHE